MDAASQQQRAAMLAQIVTEQEAQKKKDRANAHAALTGQGQSQVVSQASPKAPSQPAVVKAAPQPFSPELQNQREEMRIQNMKRRVEKKKQEITTFIQHSGTRRRRIDRDSYSAFLISFYLPVPNVPQPMTN